MKRVPPFVEVGAASALPSATAMPLSQSLTRITSASSTTSMPMMSQRTVSPARLQSYPSDYQLGPALIQRASHATVVHPATVVDATGRSTTPMRFVTPAKPGPARALTPVRVASHNTLSGSAQSSTTAIPRIKQQMHGELADIRQELQSLNDMCQQTFDAEIPGRARDRGYSQFAPAV